MSETIVGVGDPKAVKRWASALAVDVNHRAYLGKFIGRGENHVIQQLTDLESMAGDKITFDLSVQLRKPPTDGDQRIKGTEENLQFYTDEVAIDQVRAPVSAGGRMTRKRTLHDLRSIARARMSEYWAKLNDEILFVYLSGDRGINEDFIYPTTWTGRAGNSIQAPDTSHVMYGGDATSFGSISSDDYMTAAAIERAETKVTMLRATDSTVANMQPIMVEGARRYVVVMSPYQEHAMRTLDTTGWLAAQRAAAGADGQSNPIFKGKLGLIKNTVLHSHPNVIRFDDAGAGTDQPAARALYMGRQAAVIAYGTAGGSRYQWIEEKDDYDNLVNIACGCIFGVKKTRFNSKDFGVLAIDTYAAAV